MRAAHGAFNEITRARQIACPLARPSPARQRLFGFGAATENHNAEQQRRDYCADYTYR